MSNNRGILAKWFKSCVKLSRGPYKPQSWSLDPTDRGLTRPHCNYKYMGVMVIGGEVVDTYFFIGYYRDVYLTQTLTQSLAMKHVSMDLHILDQ